MNTLQAKAVDAFGKLIAERVMHATVDLIYKTRRDPNKLGIDSLTKAMKAATHARIDETLSLIQETSEAFHGHNPMVNFALHVCIAEIAVDALKRYDAEAAERAAVSAEWNKAI